MSYSLTHARTRYFTIQNSLGGGGGREREVQWGGSLPQFICTLIAIDPVTKTN